MNMSRQNSSLLQAGKLLLILSSTLTQIRSQATDCPLNLELTTIQSRWVSVSWDSGNNTCNQTVTLSITSSPRSTEWEEVLECEEQDGLVSCAPSSSWDSIICTHGNCNVTSPAVLEPCTRYKVSVRRGENVQSEMMTTDEETPGAPLAVGMQVIGPASGSWSGLQTFSVNWGSVDHLPQCVQAYRVSLSNCEVRKNDYSPRCSLEYEDVDSHDDRIVHLSYMSYDLFDVAVQAITYKRRLGKAAIISGNVLDGWIPDPNAPISITTTTTPESTTTKTTTTTTTITTSTSAMVTDTPTTSTVSTTTNSGSKMRTSLLLFAILTVYFVFV